MSSTERKATMSDQTKIEAAYYTLGRLEALVDLGTAPAVVARIAAELREALHPEEARD
jgi:hypothetical protein